MIGRYDSADVKKHMGLLLLKSIKSSLRGQIRIEHSLAKRNKEIQIQGLKVRLDIGIKFGFLYSRSTPTNKEVEATAKTFDDCNVIMGDLNLSHRIPSDQEKLSILCQTTKDNILNEITRSVSHNQLDYVLVNKELTEISYATSFHNFISDHKAITLRVGLYGNEFSESFKEILNFDQESHMKKKVLKDSEKNMSSSSSSSEIGESHLESELSAITSSSDDDLSYSMNRNLAENRVHNSSLFSRRFKNYDASTCWLNSCLQLVLTILDYQQVTLADLTSELGTELLNLLTRTGQDSLDPTKVKDILKITEDTRIALKLSEIDSTITDEEELSRQRNAIEALRFDLQQGEQCIRDFFICLKENYMIWPDVLSFVYFQMTYSSICCACNYKAEHETDHAYLELKVPPDNTHLSNHVEDFLNTSDLIGRKCEGCKKFTQAETGNEITSVEQSKYLVIILSRAMRDQDGCK